MKILPALLVAVLAATTLQAAPKKLLVVTTTTGFRHSSIPNLEKVLAQLGETSGEFTVDYVHQPPGKPAALKKDATDAEKGVYASSEAAWEQSLKVALQKLSPESLKNYDAVVFCQHHRRSADSRSARAARLDQGRARVHRHSCGERHVSPMAGLH